MMLLVGCISQQKISSEPELNPAPSLAPVAITATAVYAEAWSRFEQIMPGQTSEAEVIALLGTPNPKTSVGEYVNWWYNPPRGSITFKQGTLVAMSMSPKPLSEVISKYGVPQKVVLSKQIDPAQAGEPTSSDTWLLYPANDLVFRITGRHEAFTPDLWANATKVAPGYFNDFLFRWGIDSSKNESIPWPGLSVAPSR
jgi:hypothetical protein